MEDRSFNVETRSRAETNHILEENMIRIPTDKLIDFIEETRVPQLTNSEPTFVWGAYCFVYGYSIFANPYRNSEGDDDLYNLWKEGWSHAKELTQDEPAREG